MGDLIWLILLYSDDLLRINKDSYKKSTQCSCHPSICLLYTNGLRRTRSLCTCYFFLFHKDYVHATWRISSSTSGIVNWSVGQYKVAFIFFGHFASQVFFWTILLHNVRTTDLRQKEWRTPCLVHLLSTTHKEGSFWTFALSASESRAHHNHHDDLAGISIPLWCSHVCSLFITSPAPQVHYLYKYT